MIAAMRKILGWVVAVTATVFVGGGLLIAFGPGVELTNQLLALAGLAAGVAAVAVAVLAALPHRPAAPAAGEKPGPRQRMSENTAAIVQGALILAAALVGPAVFYLGELIWLDQPVPGWRTVVQEGYLDLYWVYRMVWLVFLLGGTALCWLGVYEKRKEWEDAQDGD